MFGTLNKYEVTTFGPNAAVMAVEDSPDASNLTEWLGKSTTVPSSSSTSSCCSLYKMHGAYDQMPGAAKYAPPISCLASCSSTPQHKSSAYTALRTADERKE